MQILLNLFRFCKYKHLCAYFNAIALTVRGPQFFGKIEPYYCCRLGNRLAHILMPSSFLLPSSCVSLFSVTLYTYFPPSQINRGGWRSAGESSRTDLDVSDHMLSARYI